MGLRLFFLPNFPDPTFIPCPTFIPEARVISSNCVNQDNCSMFVVECDVCDVYFLATIIWLYNFFGTYGNKIQLLLVLSCNSR